MSTTGVYLFVLAVLCTIHKNCHALPRGCDFEDLLSLSEEPNAPQQPNCSELSPVDIALSQCRTDRLYRVLLELAEHGADVNRRCPGGDTPLTRAVHLGSYPGVTALMDLGALADLENGRRSTPFLEAVLKGEGTIISALLEGGADVHHLLADGSNYVHRVVEEKNLWSLINLLRLLKKSGPEIKELEKRNNNDETPLSIAVRHNLVAFGNILIARGSDIWSQTAGGRTYLHLAMQNHSLDSARNLVHVGLPVGAKDSEGRTPLEAAIAEDDLNAAIFLESLGADVMPTFESRNLLLVAAQHGSVHCLKWLLSRGIPIQSNDSWGNTPLHYAVSERQLPAVKALLDLGADVNVENTDYETPLHLATCSSCGESQSEIKKLLLSKGAQ